MQTVSLVGGDNTTYSRDMYLTFCRDTLLSKVNIPVNLENNTDVTKQIRIIIYVNNSIIFDQTYYYSAEETGKRTIETEINATITIGTEVIIRAYAGSRCYVWYSSEIPKYSIEQIIVENSFEAALSIDGSSVWNITTANDGYPCLNEVKFDESEFVGYTDPKPLNSWKIDPNNIINDGYPYIWNFSEIATEQNIFFKTENGLIPLTAYYKTDNGLIPLTVKIKE